MKTAVEWLVEEINKLTGLTIQIDEPIVQQAKEMEKKQMRKAYNHGRPNLLCYEKGTAFKEYYNETFKSE